MKRFSSNGFLSDLNNPNQGGKVMGKKNGQPGIAANFNALFFPFLYFYTRKRWVMGTIALLICLVSIPLMFFFIGFMTYLIASAMALIALRNESMEAHAQRIGQATADEILRARQEKINEAGVIEASASN